MFVYICIVIVDPIIKKAEGGDPILQFTADTFLCQSQARNLIEVTTCVGFTVA